MSHTHLTHSLGGDDNSFAISSIYDLCDGEFHNYVVNSAANVRALYIDGSLVSSSVAGQPGGHRRELLPGRRGAPTPRVNRAWLGTLSDFKVYAANFQSSRAACAKCRGHDGLPQRPLDAW